MTALETGKGKVKQICDILREETLQPAHKQAHDIIEDAKRQARELIEQSQKEAHRLMEEARHKIAQEKKVFESSLEQAAHQCVTMMRQEIENHIFNENLDKMVQEASKDPQTIARLMTAIVDAVKKDGLSTQIEAIIPATLSKEFMNASLGQAFLNEIKDKSLSLGKFNGGVQVKLLDRRLTIDVTDATLKELIASFLRKDFREFLFKKKA